MARKFERGQQVQFRRDGAAADDWERGVYVEIAAGRGWHLVVEEISRIQHRVSSRRIREVPE